MAVGKRLRFEVFKRDAFTCAYCGRTPPDVLLHIDHIVPLAAGGTDALDNLITACSDCNLGKGASGLNVRPASSVSEERVQELQERIAQARAYAELVAEEHAAREKLIGRQLAIVGEFWAQQWGATEEIEEDGQGWYVLPDGGLFPLESSVRLILKRLPVEEVIEAIEITRTRFPAATIDAVHYFYGVCWNKVRQREAER
jgi:hypothetical protein